MKKESYTKKLNQLALEIKDVKSALKSDIDGTIYGIERYGYIQLFYSQVENDNYYYITVNDRLSDYQYTLTFKNGKILMAQRTEVKFNNQEFTTTITINTFDKHFRNMIKNILKDVKTEKSLIDSRNKKAQKSDQVVALNVNNDNSDHLSIQIKESEKRNMNNKNLQNYYFNKMIELIAQYSICMDIDKHFNVKTYQANGNNYYLTIKTINDNKLLSIEIGHGIAKWILEFDKNGNIASDIKSSYFNVELLKAIKDIKDKFINDLTFDKYDFIADLLSEFQVGYNYDRYDTNNLKALADYGMIEEENINDFIIKMKKIPDDHLTTEIVIYNLNEFGLDFLVNGEFYEYSDYSEYIDMFLENFGSDTREFYDRYISYLIDEKDLFEYLTKYETFAETEYGTILEIIDY